MKYPLLIATAAVFSLGSIAAAKGPEAVTDLDVALAKAKAEQRMVFVLFGRQTCGNCQALRQMIADKEVKLADAKFIYADLNCDDAAARQAFRSRFKVEGKTLPFVVIADAQGAQLAARTGYGSAKEWEQLIKTAEKKTRKAEGT